MLLDLLAHTKLFEKMSKENPNLDRYKLHITYEEHGEFDSCTKTITEYALCLGGGPLNVNLETAYISYDKKNKWTTVSYDE